MLVGEEEGDLVRAAVYHGCILNNGSLIEASCLVFIDEVEHICANKSKGN
jgi:hypothetical protein